MVMRPPPMPPLRGFVPMSLSAWEGRVAALIHVQGCNLACPGCPTPHLVARNPDLGAIPLESVLEGVYTRRRWLDAVVIGGGEPTLHEGLSEFAGLIHDFGLTVRVHTNGTRPEVLRTLLESGEVSSVSMTVRAPLEPVYAEAAGAKVRLASLYESVERLLRDAGEHEFRVPWLTGRVETEQMISVVRMLAGARRVVLVPGLDGRPGVRELRRVGRAAGHLVEQCVVAERPSEDFGRAARGRGVAS